MIVLCAFKNVASKGSFFHKHHHRNGYACGRFILSSARGITRAVKSIIFVMLIFSHDFLLSDRSAVKGKERALLFSSFGGSERIVY